ncbi:MAG: hypothetical protein V1872_00735, partial [bacterium]
MDDKLELDNQLGSQDIDALLSDKEGGLLDEIVLDDSLKSNEDILDQIDIGSSELSDDIEKKGGSKKIILDNNIGNALDTLDINLEDLLTDNIKSEIEVPADNEKDNQLDQFKVSEFGLGGGIELEDIQFDELPENDLLSEKDLDISSKEDSDLSFDELAGKVIEGDSTEGIWNSAEFVSDEDIKIDSNFELELDEEIAKEQSNGISLEEFKLDEVDFSGDDLDTLLKSIEVPKEIDGKDNRGIDITDVILDGLSPELPVLDKEILKSNPLEGIAIIGSRNKEAERKDEGIPKLKVDDIEKVSGVEIAPEGDKIGGIEVLDSLETFHLEEAEQKDEGIPELKADDIEKASGVEIVLAEDKIEGIGVLDSLETFHLEEAERKDEGIPELKADDIEKVSGVEITPEGDKIGGIEVLDSLETFHLEEAEQKDEGIPELKADDI